MADLPPPVPGLSDPSHDQATTALWCGIAGLICALVGPMACYIPMLVAFPLSGYAIWSGSQATSALDELADAGRLAGTCARGGIVAGAVGLLWSALWLGIMLLIVVFYVFIAIVAIVAGAAGAR